MVGYQNPLLSPVAKLDIKDLIEESPSPRPKATQSQAFSRSNSITSSQTRYPHTPSSPPSRSLLHYSTGTAPHDPFGPQEVRGSQQLAPQPPPPLSHTAQAVFQQNPGLNPAATSAKRPPPSGNRPSSSANKNKGKWTPPEDAKVIVLRGRGMKWDDISHEIPGRSAISCRLHYQNYLEKRADWSEEQRNKLARVYDRLKPELWNPIATELGMPWRACEAMHWALGEADMCRRANVHPFPIDTNRSEPNSGPAAGRVAQRDRMRGSTRVFEGHDITAITSPGFHSVNGQSHVPYAGGPSPMSIHGIGNGRGFPGYDGEEEEEEDEEDDEDDEEDDYDGEEQQQQHHHQQQQQQQQGPRVRRRRLGSGTRLPGLAELDRTIAADLAADLAASEAGRLIKQEEPQPIRRFKHEHDRRGSVGSGKAAGGSRRSR